MNILYIPENLNIDAIIEIYPPSEVENFNSTFVYHIAHLINMIPAMNRDVIIRDGYVPISSELLKLFAQNYRQYLDYMLRSGIILTDNRYIKTEKCKGYKFTPKYRTKVQPMYITDDRYEYQKNKHKRNMKKKKYEYKYNYLNKWFTPDLTIDFEPAYDYISNDLKNDKQDSDTALDGFIKYFIGINMIKSGQFYHNVDSSGHRYHSNLTNIKRELRRFIKFQNQPLVSIDIKNSQPYFSQILLIEDFWTSNTTLSIYNLCNKEYIKERIFPSSTIMFLKSLQLSDSQEIKAYTKLVNNGQIYEHYQDALFKHLGKKLSRDQVKDLFYISIFSENKLHFPEKTVFKKIFPSIDRIFREIKKVKHNTLANMLQRVESYIVLDIICKRISKEKKRLPIFTIHDSIITIKGYEDYLQAVMEEELQKFVGVPPILKIEYWSNYSI